MHGDESSDDVLAWHSIARIWGIAPEDLPAAVEYLYTLIMAASGSLELVEIQYRPAGERHIYRSIEAADSGQRPRRVEVNRPQNWESEDEARALEDVLESFRLECEDALTEAFPPSPTSAVTRGDAQSGAVFEEPVCETELPDTDPITLRRDVVPTTTRLRSAERTANLAWDQLRAAHEQIARSAELLRQHRVTSPS